MKKTNGGFSLTEVSVSLGIMAFAVMAVIGVFPLGLKESLAGANETRSAHLARQVFSTLSAGPFNAVPLYGRTLDLGAGQSDAVLYAGFTSQGESVIQPEKGTEYKFKLKLWVEPLAAAIPNDSAGADTQKVAASRVKLVISPLGGRGEHRFESLIGNY